MVTSRFCLLDPPRKQWSVLRLEEGEYGVAFVVPSFKQKMFKRALRTEKHGEAEWEITQECLPHSSLYVTGKMEEKKPPEADMKYVS